MIEVTSGPRNDGAVEERALHHFVQKFIPLNGSSEDRCESRRYHEMRAIAMGWPCQSRAPFVVMGGGTCPAVRGWRYVMDDKPGCRSFGWVHWRKAKRRSRHGHKILFASGWFVRARMEAKP